MFWKTKKVKTVSSQELLCNLLVNIFRDVLYNNLGTCSTLTRVNINNQVAKQKSEFRTSTTNPVGPLCCGGITFLSPNQTISILSAGMDIRIRITLWGATKLINIKKFSFYWINLKIMEKQIIWFSSTWRTKTTLSLLQMRPWAVSPYHATPSYRL